MAYNFDTTNPVAQAYNTQGQVLGTSTSGPAPIPYDNGFYAGEYTGTSGTGTGGGTGLTAEQVATNQRKAQADAMKGGIIGIVKNIQGVYDALYGDVNVAASNKNKQVLDVYGQDVGALTDQFASEFPAIGNAFSARNTYDSSYRMDREEGARQGFDNTLKSRAATRDQDLGGVGEWVATKRADIGAQKSLQDSIERQINESSNPDELTSLRNQLDAKLAEVNASRAGLQSQASYLDTLNQAVPAGSRLEGLRTSLTNVIKSQVPTALKQTIAQNLIQNAGLSTQDAAAALQGFNIQLSQDENLTPTA